MSVGRFTLTEADLLAIEAAKKVLRETMVERENERIIELQSNEHDPSTGGGT